MKVNNKTAVANIQESCGMLASMAEQTRVDARQLHSLGLCWLQEKYEKWYHKSECHLKEFIDRLLAYGVDPDYEIAKPEGMDDVEPLVTRTLASANALKEHLAGARQNAWESAGDDLVDIYEHALQFAVKMVISLERESRLIAKLGNDEYISARLEDE